LNQLFRFTPLQTSFGVNMLALNQGRPELLPLRAMLEAFIRFREEVIRRRTIYELGKARDRAHVLVGLAVAVASLDEVIELIKTSPDPQTARQRLMDRRWPAAEVEPFIALIDEPGRGIVDGHYTLSETQARAILDLRLHRLTGLEREKIQEELTELGKLIENYLQILRDRVRLYQIMREELVEMREAFATPRRTELLEAEFEHDIEDLIQHEDMVVTVTNTGYIKRVPLTSYRAQRRGGKGRSGMAVRDEDFITTLFVADTHAPLLFFTSDGMVYKLKVYRLPLGTPQARGKAIVNMIPINSEARVTAIMPLPEDEERWGDLDVMFSTESGGVRRNRLSDFTNVMANGKIAMKLDEGDQLIGVRVCTENDDVLLASRDGKCIRFAVPDVRVFAGRTSTGVRGIKLSEGDKVISMSILTHVDADAEERTTYLKKANELRRLENGDPESDGANAVFGDEDTEDDDPYSHYVELSGERIQELADQEQLLLTITENGFGKRTSAYEYRVSGRGGKG
ncbi:MAG: DNA gyrase C-terminal beta-propeller domain-containing protein, partial [Rhodospirillaceae bacterium]